MSSTTETPKVNQTRNGAVPNAALGTAILTYLWEDVTNDVYSAFPVFLTSGSVPVGFWRLEAFDRKLASEKSRHFAVRFFGLIEQARRRASTDTAAAGKWFRGQITDLGLEVGRFVLPAGAKRAVDDLTPGTVLLVASTEWFVPWELVLHEPSGKSWGEIFAVVRVALPSRGEIVTRAAALPRSSTPTSGSRHSVIVLSGARDVVAKALTDSLGGSRPDLITSPPAGDRWTYEHLKVATNGCAFLGLICHGTQVEAWGHVICLNPDAAETEYLSAFRCTQLALAARSTVVLGSCFGGLGSDGIAALARVLAIRGECLVVASWSQVYDHTAAEIVRGLFAHSYEDAATSATELMSLRNDLFDAGYFDSLAFGATVSPIEIGGLS